MIQPLPQYKTTMASYSSLSGFKTIPYLIHIYLVITNLRTINIINNYSIKKMKFRKKELRIGGFL